MSRSVRLALIACAIAATTTTVSAAPPPPPPPEVFDVANLLIGSDDEGSRARLATYVAPDVKVYLNGKLVADGKAGWASYLPTLQRRSGGVLAHSFGWEADGISLMLADEYDTVDRSNLPPNIVIDPRTATRTTLYQFGMDRKIHTIRTLVGAGFWIGQKR